MVRVHELATELEVPSSKVLEIFKALGIEGKSHSSSVTKAEAQKIKRAVASKSMRTSRVSGRRDFRVRDISTPSAKSPSIRPRPTMQTQESGRRVVTRKVVKRVVRRTTPDTDRVVDEKTVEAPLRKTAKPELPDINKAVRDIDKSMTSVGGKVETVQPDKKTHPAKNKPSGPADTSNKPRPPRDKRRRRGRGKRDDQQSGKPGSNKLSQQVYSPVGKDGKPQQRQRPPKPKVPRIPNPNDYLKPRSSSLEKSMEKLATSGMKSSIDKRPPRSKPPAKPADSGQRKRRRKIIKDDKKPRGPQGGRGRRGGAVRQQVQKQLDTSTTVRKRGRRRGRDRVAERRSTVVIPKIIKLGEHVSIKELSAFTGLKSSAIISFLMKELEVFATINQTVDQEIGGLICDHFGFEYELTKIKEVEDILKYEEDAVDTLETRPPVVTVLGHVDHGKTKLLDAIRGTDVVATEAGGITQRIGAFQVDVPTSDGTTRSLTFIDTPGHAAFTAMRARGAEVTDIAILVVAANDGVMPQTLEAIDHAKSAGVEIIVAINKIDLRDSNPELVKQQLSEQGLVPEEWGGQIIMAPVSAKKKIGIEDLLEQILTVTDILELKANPAGMAEGSIIEARLDKGRGALATVLISRGTLNIGDYVVVGRSWGRIRQMTDEDGKTIEIAGPSTPVMISGLNNVPAAGDKLNEVKNEKTAREIFEKREMEHRQGRLKMVNTISLEDFYKQLSKGELKELNIILKADLQGSIEAIRGQLEQLSTNEVSVKFIHTAVGNVTDSDIMLAMASQAVILGFNVVASPEIRKQASMEGIDIMTYNIIYKVVEDIHASLEGLLEPEFKEKINAEAEVREIFKKTNKLVVAGLYVETGKLVRGAEIRIIRDGEKIHEMRLPSLKRFKDNVKEVEHGMECGIMLEGYTDLREGDKIVSHETIKILRTLDASRRETEAAAKRS